MLTINYAGTTGHLYAKKLKLDPYIAQYTKSNPKGITDINVKPKTHLAKTSKRWPPKQCHKRKKGKLDFIKISKSILSKTYSKKEAIDGEKKTFSNHICDKRLAHKIYKQFSKLNKTT